MTVPINYKSVYSSSYLHNSSASIASSSYSKPSLVNWAPPLRSGRNELTPWQKTTLNARAWDALYNQDLAVSIVNQLKTNVINTGLSLNPTIDGKALGLTFEQEHELETAVRKEFAIWSKQCDIQRILNFN